MNRIPKWTKIGLTALLLFFLIPSIASASTGPAQPAFIILSHENNGMTLFLEPNQNGQVMFPEWNISILTNAFFKITLNNSTITQGTGPYSETLNLSQYQKANFTITIGNTEYIENNVSIIGETDPSPIISAEITTTLSGQPTLTAQPGQTGQILHQNATITMISTQQEPYKIYVNGNMISTGTAMGTSSINTTLPTGDTSIQVIIGSTILNFNNEIVTSLTLQKYYGPQPPPLVATLIEEIFSTVKGVLAAIADIPLLYLGVSGLIKTHKNRTPEVW
uniref:Uncharacterized protein n=1 Tax=Thermoplasma acidophilum TaxID=2303 RepID=Q0KKY4_THEAI|nr:hypothetical protein [Thermoplasma acidophilum]